MLSSRRTVLGGILGAPLASVVAGTSLPAHAQEQAKPVPQPRPLDAPIDVAVPVHPTTFTAGGKKHLVYELHLTNFGRTECQLSRLEALANGRTLASYSGDD